MTKEISHRASVVLDLFRGFSAQLVLIGHLISFFGIQQKYKIPIIQNFGVMVFFILSGFLITQTSKIKGVHYGFKAYVIDRFSRIYYTFIPALIFVLIIDSILKFYFNQYDPSFKFDFVNFISNTLLLQGIPYVSSLGIESFGSARQFWTVSIEWWIYIFFGILFYLNSIKRTFWLYLIFSICFLVVLYNINGRGDGLTIYWLFGFLLSVLYNLAQLEIKYKSFLIILLFIICCMIYRVLGDKSGEMYDVGLASIFSLFLFVLINAPKQFNFLDNKLIVKAAKFTASYSYSLYLTHYSVILLMQVYFTESFDYGAIGIIFIVANIVAFTFYLLFEKNYYVFKKWIKKG